jgi:hypothetical protein
VERGGRLRTGDARPFSIRGSEVVTKIVTEFHQNGETERTAVRESGRFTATLVHDEPSHRHFWRADPYSGRSSQATNSRRTACASPNPGRPQGPCAAAKLRFDCSCALDQRKLLLASTAKGAGSDPSREELRPRKVYGQASAPAPATSVAGEQDLPGSLPGQSLCRGPVKSAISLPFNIGAHAAVTID